MNVEVRLRCDECGAVESPKLHLRWAPWGVLNLRGACRFYVDGGRTLCPEHTETDRERRQRWSYDLAREASER